MTKKTLSSNKKIVLDNAYLTHLTIKWKDVTKNEKAIVTVMGMAYKGTISIPITLQLLGHNEEVIKEKTENTKLESNGCSAICRFDVKNVMGNLKEEEVAEITATINMNGQRLDVPFHKNRLRIATTCLERWHEAIKQNDAKKVSDDKNTYFKWGELKETPSSNQTRDGVQNAFNYSYSSQPYHADPRAFEMEEAVDIGIQIQQSIKEKGGMFSEYSKASKTPGKPYKFTWIKTGDNIKATHGFNSSVVDQFFSKALPFGRVSATIEFGEITVCGDGSYFVVGQLVYIDDYFSWQMDGKDTLHNIAIGIGGNEINRDQNNKNPVRWRNPSEAWDDSNKTKEGQMKIKYVRDYYFYTHGKI